MHKGFVAAAAIATAQDLLRANVSAAEDTCQGCAAV